MDLNPNPNPTLTVFHDIYLSYDDQRHNDGILDEEQSWQRTEICRYLVNGPRMVVSSNAIFHWHHLTKEGSKQFLNPSVMVAFIDLIQISYLIQHGVFARCLLQELELHSSSNLHCRIAMSYHSTSPQRSASRHPRYQAFALGSNGSQSRQRWLRGG